MLCKEWTGQARIESEDKLGTIVAVRMREEYTVNSEDEDEEKGTHL